MTKDLDDPFDAVLSHLNSALQLWDCAEISPNSNLAEALRFHIKGGDADAFARRPTTMLRARLAAEQREKTMRSRFSSNGLATTSGNRHIHLIGFDKDGFAYVEGFYWDVQTEAFVFADYVHRLPVQSSLSPCRIASEIARTKAVDSATVYEILSGITPARAERHRQATNLKA